MEEVAAYLKTLCSGAILCAVVLQMTGKDSPGGAAGKLLCALAMTVLAISPLKRVDFGALDREFSDFSMEAEAAAMDGRLQAEEALAEGISQRCRSYILDQAGAFPLDVRVELDGQTHLPVSVTLEGSPAPEQKRRLEEWIVRELGVERSRIRWKP